MRDAIQGMLSMSRMGGIGNLSLTGAQPFDMKPKTSIRLHRDGRGKRKLPGEEEPTDRMPNCFKDEEYGQCNL